MYVILNILEWFFNLFLSKKAKALKKQVIIERAESIAKYKNIEEINKKYLARYSGKKRYVKVPT